ncbi:hypothetical protein DERF_005866 [Dermatophagoides farinae]|uniref:Uncharacterized protein n=1 Tax=Dermatophagoides farinae TaxID=6954 RepID=A0A922L725_DERFA|nr:hypothetical protein DERF_005866 [Dermatophagoides farinae]
MWSLKTLFFFHYHYYNYKCPNKRKPLKGTEISRLVTLGTAPQFFFVVLHSRFTVKNDKYDRRVCD